MQLCIGDNSISHTKLSVPISQRAWPMATARGTPLGWGSTLYSCKKHLHHFTVQSTASPHHYTDAQRTLIFSPLSGKPWGARVGGGPLLIACMLEMLGKILLCRKQTEQGTRETWQHGTGSAENLAQPLLKHQLEKSMLLSINQQLYNFSCLSSSLAPQLKFGLVWPFAEAGESAQLDVCSVSYTILKTCRRHRKPRRHLRHLLSPTPPDFGVAICSWEGYYVFLKMNLRESKASSLLLSAESLSCSSQLILPTKIQGALFQGFSLSANIHSSLSPLKATTLFWMRAFDQTQDFDFKRTISKFTIPKQLL